MNAETFENTTSATAQEEKLTDEHQLVTFNLDDEEFGVDILTIREINRVTDITVVPNAPSFVEGVVDLRGEVVPVIDLKKRFHKGNVKLNNQSRIIVVNINDKMTGLMVDSVSQTLRLTNKDIDPPPAMVAGIDSAYIQGLGKVEDRLIILLDLNKILSFDELEAL